MAARLISFPFRLDANGAVATVGQGSDEEIEQQIAVAMLTRPGERITVPTYGVNDPAFSGFLLSHLIRQVTDFGPRVTIENVSVDKLDEGREKVVVKWTRIDGIREVPPQ
jgi:phage baseplate assembly protein W